MSMLLSAPSTSPRKSPRLFAGLLVGALLLAATPAYAQLIPSFGRDRAGTSGFQFLKMPADARSAALGETAAANAFDGSALFWNPALAAQADGHQVAFSHTRYYADVNLEYAAAFFQLPRPALTIGAHVQVLNSGDMDVTTETMPFGTGETFRFTDIAAGLTVAQALTDLFSYGVTAKYLRESVAGVAFNTAVIDLGFFYRIGTTGAQMAVAIRNFGLDAGGSGEISRIDMGTGGVPTKVVEDEFESLTPPTTFLLGLTYNVFRPGSGNELMLSGQITNPNDNAESLNFGAEYIWNHVLALRAGYRLGTEGYTVPSLGAGIYVPLSAQRLRVDYGFSRLEELGAVHRIGVNLSL